MINLGLILRFFCKSAPGLHHRGAVHYQQGQTKASTDTGRSTSRLLLTNGLPANPEWIFIAQKYQNR